MTWIIKYAASTRKDLKKIGPEMKNRIRRFLETRVAHLENPRQLGKSLQGEHADLWRYRVGDYRLICELRDNVLVVLVVRIGHRKNIYR